MSSKNKHWFLEERFVFGLVAITSLLGIFSWFNISEQEDPFFPYRNGHVIIVAPGMSSSAIENTIVKPFERMLANIDGIGRVSSSSSDSRARVHLQLQDSVYNTEQVWQRVREKVTEAATKYAHLVTEFSFNDKIQDTEGILLNIQSNQSLLDTRQYALHVRDEMYKLSEVRKAEIIGDPGEEIEVLYSQDAMLELGISPPTLARHIREANAQKNIGILKGGQYQSNISSITHLANLASVRNIEIETPDSNILTLSDFTQIRRVTPPNRQESFWINGKRSIGVSIAVPPNQLRVVEFGNRLLNKIDELNKNNAGYTITPIFFQPEWTEKRRNNLTLSLFYSSIAVGIVLFILMSPKVALMVSLTIPAITLSSIAIFGILGGVLHQISIAGLVISLGLMVDNCIVMSELISRHRQQGLTKIEASQKAIRELFRPLATSTFTTVAAFVPMLLSKGNVADFVRMIPIIVIIAIITSYIFSLTLLPVITNGISTLREGKNAGHLEKLGLTFSGIGTRHPKLVICAFIALVIASLSITDNKRGEFFPKSNRNIVVIDIEENAGLSHSATLETVKKVEDYIREKAYAEDIISFVGHSGSRFYYNLTSAPNKPNIARVILKTNLGDSPADIVNKLNQDFPQHFTSTRIWARQIGQGPPIDAPIEVRILGKDRQTLLAASEEVYALIDQDTATKNTRRGYVIAKPVLNFSIDDFNTQQAGIKRSDISDYISWRTIGITATEVTRERDAINVVIRDNNLDKLDSQHIMNTVLLSNKGEALPLSLFATPNFIGETPNLTRWKGYNSHVVQADVVPNYNPAHVTNDLKDELMAIADKHNVELEFRGVTEKTANSNSALLQTLPIGALLLFGALILQFNSYRIVGLIIITIPLAMIGVPPTLSLVGVKFGFMSVLGLLALTGIVVNTAIILIDSVLVKVRDHGQSLLNAIESATQERFRPILLTACTTIVGMIPLTSPTSPLWPPMAWTIIGGLLTSTLLSLVVLPAFLLITLDEKKIRGNNP